MEQREVRPDRKRSRRYSGCQTQGGSYGDGTPGRQRLKTIPFRLDDGLALSGASRSARWTDGCPGADITVSSGKRT